MKDLLEFGESLGSPPYCYRWVINFGLFALRLHHWVADDIHEHNHPYWMFIICFSGWYTDVSDDEKDIVQAPTWRLRKPSHKHTVITQGAWTFLITGPKLYRWHLFKDGKKYHPTKYFARINNDTSKKRLGCDN